MRYLLGAALGLGLVAITGTGVSAAVVCNDEGDCWRVKERYTYPPDVTLNVYEDDYVIDEKKYRWRDPGVGRGYWRGGVWIGF
jgi:hypothetical protein